MSSAQRTRRPSTESVFWQPGNVLLNIAAKIQVSRCFCPRGRCLHPVERNGGQSGVAASAILASSAGTLSRIRARPYSALWARPLRSDVSSP